VTMAHEKQEWFKAECVDRNGYRTQEWWTRSYVWRVRKGSLVAFSHFMVLTTDCPTRLMNNCAFPSAFAAA
jgi:hypothetical protein